MTTPEKRVPAPPEFERVLVEFINTTLLAGKATVDRDTRLFEDGYMNSLRILDLIAVVEKTLGRRIPDRTVRLANFRTIAAIVAAFHPDAAATPLASAAAAAPVVERSFERRKDRSRFASPIDGLVAGGALRVTGPGQVALAGIALDVFHAVDHTVALWARAIGAVEHRYPSLIDAAVLERAGRFDVIPSGGAVGAAGEESDSSPARTPLSGGSRFLATLGMTATLSPAICYHAYPAWEGKTLGAEPELLTAVGRCFRHEGGNFVPLERLFDFTMREIIILGARDQVEAQRQSLMTQVAELVTHLDLDAAIEPAADPFFAAGDEGRRLMQQAAALKHELQLTVDATGWSIAAASFNHHHDYFGTRFAFRLTNGEFAHSGCVAFGLERWVLAVMSQHGVDEARWPVAVRTWVANARDHRREPASPSADGARA